MERSEVKTEYKWKVEDLFANDEEWEKAYAEVSNALDFSAYRGTLNTPENILAYFKAEEAVEIKLLRVYGYAFLRHDEDVRVTKYNSYFARVMTLITRLGAETSFATPEISALPEATLDALVKNPKLKDYDYMLSRLKAKKKYILSEKEERILAQTQEPMNAANEAFEMLDNADLNLPEIEYEGKKQQLSHGLYSVIMFGSDRKKRAEAFKLYYSAYRKLINTLASTYHSNVKQDIFYKNVRGYASCLEMALFNEDVDRSVYDNLVSTVNECAPVMHRYMQVRKKTLGFDEMHVYDMHTPLVENAELRLTYEEAYELVLKGLAPLGKEYNAL